MRKPLSGMRELKSKMKPADFFVGIFIIFLSSQSDQQNKYEYQWRKNLAQRDHVACFFFSRSVPLIHSFGLLVEKETDEIQLVTNTGLQ